MGVEEPTHDPAAVGAYQAVADAFATTRQQRLRSDLFTQCWEASRIPMDLHESQELLEMEREEFRGEMASRGAKELWASLGRRVAVVLSGGGARGAYEAGALLAFQDAQVPTHILTATSVGSINAASYAASSDTLVGNAEPLVQFWRELSSTAIGIEWTRLVFMLAGFVAAVTGFGNLVLEWLRERNIVIVHFHDPALTWLFLGLAGVSILFFHDRLSYIGFVARNLVHKRHWRPEKSKLVLSLLANATVWGLILVVLNPAHLHLSLAALVQEHPTMAATAIVAAALLIAYRRSLRTWASALSHKFLRSPFRTGLFPNFERTRFLRERIAIDRLHASPMRVVITTTDLKEGTERFFSNAATSALAADSGVNPVFVAREIEPAEDLLKVLTASSALPVIYEAVDIGSRTYTDGSVVVSQPIRPAICLGADVLFLVMVRSQNQERGEMKTFLDLGIRALDILMVQNLHADLKALGKVNQLCEEHAREMDLYPEQVDIKIGRRAYRYLKVFMVSPKHPLPAGLLDFDGKTAGPMIRQGYGDARRAIMEFLAYANSAPPSSPKYTVRLTPASGPPRGENTPIADSAPVPEGRGASSGQDNQLKQAGVPPGGEGFISSRERARTTMFWRLLASLIWVSSVPAQEPPPIRVDVNLVTLVATVTSRSGGYVGGLKKEDFRVYEDGALQEIAVFESKEVPVSVGILFDTSGSMVDKMEDVQDAVLHFAKTANPQDEVFVIRFNNEVELVLDFTSDRPRLERAVRGLRAGGATQLYDAIVQGLEVVRHGRHPKKALLVVTDGNDTASSAKLEEAVRLAQKSEVLIYALGIGHSGRGSFAHVPGEFRDEVDMKSLNAFSEATGGKSYHLEAAHRGEVDLIDQACLEVSAELRQQYLIGYYPTNKAKDGSYRRIRVETRDKAHQVRTRRGYIAQRPNP